MKPPFTLYDFRWEWATEESKINIMRQLNTKAIEWFEENTKKDN